MFCPQCKTEYRPGFTRCADCGAELVERLPEKVEQTNDKEPVMEPDNTRLIPILQTMDQADVVSIRLILDSESIEYYLQGDALSGFRNVDPVVLLVREDDAERVRELLKGIKLNYSNQTFNPKKKR